MTDIEQKALALVNEAMADHNLAPHHKLHPSTSPFHDAICRAIEQHEAFRQEVSDAVADAIAIIDNGEEEVAIQELSRFIVTKPDPLVEAIREMALADATCEDADRLRAAIEKRGGKIVWGEKQ